MRRAGPAATCFTTQGHHVLRYRNKGGEEKLAVLPSRSVRALFAYQAVRAPREGGEANQLTGLLFVTITGTALASRDIRNLVKEMATGAGLAEVDRITPRILRYSGATLLLEQKRDLLEIMDFSGTPTLAHADLPGQPGAARQQPGLQPGRRARRG